MKVLKKVALALLTILIMVGVWFYPKFKMLNQVIHLFEEEYIVENFRSFDKVWPISEMKAPSDTYQYVKGKREELPKQFTFRGENYNTEQFLMDSWTTGLLVIQNDTIVYEDYYLGNTESTRNISWSMAKSFVSALIGIAIQEGDIENVMQPIEMYVPRLKGTAYEGVKIKDILQMSTGVKFNEDYGDYDSDINRWGRGFAWGDSQDAFPATLEREVEPGTVNHYVSINTHVLGMLLVAATGRTITDYMQEKLWNPMKMENDAYWLVDGEKMEMALGGLNATLRDYAKIGSLYMKGGFWHGKQIVPREWIEASLNPDAPHLLPGDDFGYGYQWWIPESSEGEFMALGVYNQNVYINPTTKTVIVKLSANPKYNDETYVPSSDFANLELYRAIVERVRK